MISSLETRGGWRNRRSNAEAANTCASSMARNTPRREIWNGCGHAGWPESARSLCGNLRLVWRRWNGLLNESRCAASTNASSAFWLWKASPLIQDYDMKFDPRVYSEIAAQPYPLLFATISGAHLYGFPSPDSDFDLRGVHILPIKDVVGLDVRDETVEDSRVIEGLEMDIVSHDIRKFFKLLLKKNGYVLEQLFSPLVVQTTPEHDELKEIARYRGNRGVITKHHSHHYFGFAETEWKLFLKESPRRVKPLLYVYRVLLTGIHLMRTGRIEANLLNLNEEFRLPYLAGLVE